MVFSFTIDKLTNRFVPPSQIHKLPGPLRRFLGGYPPSPTDDYFIWLEILLASFCGIGLLAGVFQSHTALYSHHATNIVASWGASAILCFNASQVPLAQPRNVVFGQFISSLIGICIQKLFSLSEGGRDNYWASAALSVAVSSVVMSICNCVHPPGGASAMLPSIDEQVRNMSWWFLPVQLISSALFIPVACIFGNIFRRYPVYWWTAAECGQFWKKESEKPLESTESTKEAETASESPEGAEAYSPSHDVGSPLAPASSHGSLGSRWSHRPLAHTESRKTLDEGSHTIEHVRGINKITITADKIVLPERIELDDVSLDFLRSMRMELKQLHEAHDSMV